MTDIKTEAKDLLSRVESLYSGLKANTNPPRWLCSSKFFVAFATIISIWLLGDKLGKVVDAVAAIACTFLIARAYTEIGQAKIADAREARLTELMTAGKATPEEVAALNKLLG